MNVHDLVIVSQGTFVGEHGVMVSALLEVPLWCVELEDCKYCELPLNQWQPTDYSGHSKVFCFIAPLKRSHLCPIIGCSGLPVGFLDVHHCNGNTADSRHTETHSNCN